LAHSQIEDLEIEDLEIEDPGDRRPWRSKTPEIEDLEDVVK
jgi:hypothetical protein